MLRVQTPSDVDVIVSFTFERQARTPLLDDFKAMLVSSPDTIRCLELEGARDFMVEARLPNLAAVHDFVARKIDPHRRLISHFEVNFVARYFLHEPDDADTDLWTSDRHGSRRVELDRADCISAEGDYVRVRANGGSVLIHATLQSIAERLPSPPFIQIHRSTLIHLGSVTRLRKDGRRWSVELRDGSTHAIAKGRNSEVYRLIEEAGRPERSHSSTPVQPNGSVGPIKRKAEAGAAH